MSKKDKDVETVVEEVAAVVPPAPVKRFTFDQWFTQRGLKDHHKSGIKAFCNIVFDYLNSSADFVCECEGSVTYTFGGRRNACDFDYLCLLFPWNTIDNVVV